MVGKPLQTKFILQLSCCSYLTRCCRSTSIVGPGFFSADMYLSLSLVLSIRIMQLLIVFSIYPQQD